MKHLKSQLLLGSDRDDLIDDAWRHRRTSDAAEIIFGRKGDDLIYGFGGGDLIDGGPGNDTINGGQGSDTYAGGVGSDRYVFEPDGGVDTLVEGKDSLNSVDSVLLAGLLFDIAFEFDGQDLLIGPAQSEAGFLDPANSIRIVDQYAGYGGGIEYFEGDTPENNAFYTDQSVVPGGIARIYTPPGTTGSDQGPYLELIRGTENDDTMVGGGGYRDELHGLSGHDLLIGSDITQDRLFGGDGNDTLYGFGGSDRFRGQQGDDVICGGEGNDRVEYSGLAGGATDAVHVDLNLQDVAQFISASQGWDTLLSIEQVRGSNFNDTLIGDDGNNFLLGGLGASFADGDDLIIGNGGDDGLNGSDGNDTLIGGSGVDELNGAAGADTFLYTEVGDGISDVDFIADLQVWGGGDVIDVSDVLTGFDPNASDLAEFVNVVNDFDGAGNSLLQIDPDGSAGPAGLTDVAVLAGITGFNAQDLYDFGNLVVSD